MNEKDFAHRLDTLHPRLRAVSVRLAPRGVAPDDLLQDTLERAWARRDSFRDDSALSTWVYRIMFNRARDLARRDVPHITQLDFELPALAELPEVTIERLEVSAQIRAAMAELSSLDRLVLAMKDGEGWTMAQVAELAGSSEATAQKRLQRARRRLANAVLAAECSAPLRGVASACHRARREAVSHLDGALPPATATRLERHMTLCHSCPPFFKRSRRLVQPYFWGDSILRM